MCCCYMVFLNMDRVMFKEKKKASSPSVITPNKDAFFGLISIGIMVLSAFLIFNSLRSIQIAREKIEILNQAKKEVGDLRLKNITLILQKETIETDDYTETDIRNRLNYSKKGEVMFVIPDDIFASSLDRVNKILLDPDEQVKEVRSVWEQWYDLFVKGV